MDTDAYLQTVIKALKIVNWLVKQLLQLGFHANILFGNIVILYYKIGIFNKNCDNRPQYYQCSVTVNNQ